jgi:hypothetical protein
VFAERAAVLAQKVVCFDEPSGIVRELAIDGFCRRAVALAPVLGELAEPEAIEDAHAVGLGAERLHRAGEHEDAVRAGVGDAGKALEDLARAAGVVLHDGAKARDADVARDLGGLSDLVESNTRDHPAGLEEGEHSLLRRREDALGVQLGFLPQRGEDSTADVVLDEVRAGFPKDELEWIGELVRRVLAVGLLEHGDDVAKERPRGGGG